MCYKDDLEYKNDEEMDEYPTQSLNQDKCITQKYYFNNGELRFTFILLHYNVNNADSKIGFSLTSYTNSIYRLHEIRL